MTPVVRRARPEELGAIVEIVAEARRFIALSGSDQWQDGYPEEALIARDIEAGIGYVLEADGAVGAYAVFTPEPEPIYEQISGNWKAEGRYITIHRLAVGDRMRRRGAGTALLRHAETLAREGGIASLRADTHRMNAAMQGLLSREGFAFRGEVNYPVTAGDPVRVAYEKLL